MNCPNCGKELAEGEICTCTAENNAAPEANIPKEPEYQPSAGAYYSPNVNQQSYYQPVPPVNSYEPGYQQPPQPQYYVPELKPPARTDYPEGYAIKKKYIAVLLGFILGTLGIHNFYLGNTSKAIAQLLLTTVGAIIVVGPVISLVWSLVETVLLFTENIDADANNFKIQTFEESLAEKLNK